MRVTKFSGEEEAFERDKFCSSLEEAGADSVVIQKVCDVVEKKLPQNVNTEDIFKTTSRVLLKENLSVAIRYNLKRAMFALGPAGFHFEHYIEHLLKAEGFVTKRNIMVLGACVSHEVDVIAEKESAHFFLEMKYHNDQKTKTGIDVVMYAYARLLDMKSRKEKEEGGFAKHEMWLVTNAKFTSKAVEYGTCMNIRMTGWSYPKGDQSLEAIVRKTKLYPVTIFPSVTRALLEQCVRHDLLFAEDLLPYQEEKLKSELGLNQKHAGSLRREVEALFKERV